MTTAELVANCQQVTAMERDMADARRVITLAEVDLIFAARACEVTTPDELTEDAIAYMDVSLQARGRRRFSRLPLRMNSTPSTVRASTRSL